MSGASVTIRVEELTRDATVIVFKKHRRKNYRRTKGHRREVTVFRVVDIKLPGEQDKDPNSFHTISKGERKEAPL